MNDATTASIRARTEQQAMDWSLVLASQGIQCVLDRDLESGAWRLVLGPNDHQRALGAIREFNRETRRSRWEHQLPDSELSIHAGVLIWVFLVALLHSIGNPLVGGEMLYPAVAKGEWWRAFTAVWLHEDLAHLASNGVMGTLLLGLAMARFGPGTACLATWLAGAAGNFLALQLRRDSPIPGLGASGMVMAALGMLAAQALPLWRRGRRGTRLLLGGLAAGTILFVQLGTSLTTDVFVHAVGFGSGLILGGVLAVLPDRFSPTLNRAAWAIVVPLFVVTWWLAVVR